MKPAPPQSRSGVRWYVGAPQTGKTTLALRHASQLVTERDVPLLVLDWGGVSNFLDEYHVHTPAAAVEELYGAKEHTFYTPASREDADELLAAVYEAGDSIVLIDEAHYQLGRHATSKPLLRLMRAHAHRRVHVLLTTQHLTGDIPQEAFACSPLVHVFRTSARTALERLEDDYGLDPNQLRALETGAYIRVDAATDSIDVVTREGFMVPKAEPQLDLSRSQVDKVPAEGELDDSGSVTPALDNPSA